MLKKTWSVSNEIIKRVQKESEVEFWDNYQQTEIPKVPKCEGIKYTAGYVNFAKTVLLENLKQLKP